MRDNSLVRGLMGPVGSGKSSACCFELLRRAKTQQPGPDGVRRSRWLVVRNTYAELKHTTIRTFQSWFDPAHFGPFTSTPPMTQILRFDDVVMEVVFLALDHPEDIRKLKSFECTGAWVNEASEVRWEVIRTLLERVGRYPAVKDGGATWRGIIMDTNPPDDRHWWFRLFEEKRPPGWALYKQPSGLSAEAENIKNLPPDYYQNIVDASVGDPDRVNVMVHGKYGVMRSGEAVFGQQWDETTHVAAETLHPLPPNLGRAVVVGMDFGLTPAAVFLQQQPSGRWHALYELVCDGMMGAEQFAPLIKQVMVEKFAPGQGFELYGDPAGNQRSQADARTAFDVFRGMGLLVKPSPTQNLADRLAVVRTVLARQLAAGKGMLVSPGCLRLRQALRAGYHYPLVHDGANPRPADKPAKNEHSHIADALQYALAGGGEWQRLRSGSRRMKQQGQMSDFFCF